MEGVSGFRKYIAVLLLQTIVLFALLAFAVFAIWILPSYGIEAGAVSFFGFLFAALSLNAVLAGMWFMLADLTETLWSIRAAQRVKQWLLKSLLIGGAVSLLAIAWLAVAFSSEPAMAISQPWFRLIFTAVLVFAAGLPFLASSLLTAGALKHFAGMRRGLKAMSQSIDIDDDDKLKRIAISVKSELGLNATDIRPGPKGFYVTGLTSKPWHERDEFPWVSAFDDAFDDILNEAEDVLKTALENLEPYSYPGIDESGWRRFSFVEDRRENVENLARCPATAQALKATPGYPLFRDAMFSILEPGAAIKAHRDQTNLFLTMHFGLKTPGDGFLEVAGIRRQWQSGKSLFFDSSYQHRAINRYCL